MRDVKTLYTEREIKEKLQLPNKVLNSLFPYPYSLPYYVRYDSSRAMFEDKEVLFSLDDVKNALDLYEKDN